MDSGHYVSFFQSPDSKWYLVNDAHVRLLSNSNVLSNNAYILFYIRQDVKDAGFRSLFNTHESKEDEEAVGEEEEESGEKKKCSIL